MDVSNTCHKNQKQTQMEIVLLRLSDILREAEISTNNRETLEKLICFSHILKNADGSITFIDIGSPNQEIQILDFLKALQTMLIKSTASTFLRRDYFSYSEDDFIGHSEINEALLKIIFTLLNILYNEHKSYNSSNKTNTGKEDHKEKAIDSKENSEIEPLVMHVAFQKTKLLLYVLTFIGANIENSMWSSANSICLSSDLLKLIMKICLKDSVDDLLHLNIIGMHYDKSHNECLFASFIEQYKIVLSKEHWQKNPMICQVFHWFVRQSKFPNLSKYIDVLMSVSLNMLFDHQECNKIKGLEIIEHMLVNITKEEIRWYNRINVIHEALNRQIHLKDSKVLNKLFSPLLKSLEILDQTALKDYHRQLLETLLRNADMENLLILRRIYISNLSSLIYQTGFSFSGVLSLAVKVIINYLEVDGGSCDTCRLETLDLLQTVVEVAWLRIPLHACTIIKALLKLYVDIQTLLYQETHSCEAQDKMKLKIIGVSRVLCKLCPNIRQSIEALKDSNHNQNFKFHMLI